MTLDPELAVLAALTMAIGYTMFFSGLKKRALELKRRQAHLPLLRPHDRRPRLPQPLHLVLFQQLSRAPLTLRGRLDERDVAELAAGARLLAVQVEVRAGDAQDGVGVGHRADQVDEQRGPRRRSSRAAARGSRGGGSRTGSSRSPRSSSGRCCGRAARSRSRAAARRRRRARARGRRRSRARRAVVPAYSSASRLRRVDRRRPRRAQDPVLVDVLDERPEPRLAVAAAHGEQRELAVERDTFLEDVSGDSPRTGLHQTLALSVVAENPWFQEGWEGLDLVVDPRGGNPELSEQPLFHKPVLRDFERAGRRDRAHPPRRIDRARSRTRR